AGLLALAGVLGIGEGHLLHQKTRWGGVRLFCQNQKVFFRLSLGAEALGMTHNQCLYRAELLSIDHLSLVFAESSQR
ncbi:hypothetical protein, partial [Pseudomonas aeruginosa]|uniref:hypothetical protein n=1 Tax=Pseudomonas aeruginosa TaxID=287 RepID=UPI0040539C50